MRGDAHRSWHNTHTPARLGWQSKKDVDSWKKNVQRNEKTNTEMHMGSRNNVVLQALLYSDHTEAYPLAMADQSNTVFSGAEPGSDPPLCNLSAELEHQRLASDQGVQWPGQEPGRELPDTPVTIITQTAAHTQFWSVSLVSKFGSRLPGHSRTPNVLVELTYDLFLIRCFPHFCCKLFYK